MSDSRIEQVVDLLSSLILTHAGMTAREQYCPGRDPDGSDELIRARTEWVRELRDIRQRVENLVTGILIDDERARDHRSRSIDDLLAIGVDALRKISKLEVAPSPLSSPQGMLETTHIVLSKAKDIARSALAQLEEP